MPLLDHFHEPLVSRRAWESFHARWVNSIADALQATLPRRYFAEIQVHLGRSVEADVAEFEITANEEEPPNGSTGGVAVQTWAPPAPPVVFTATFLDDIEVHVRDERNDGRLVAVVELVSPANKDRPETRSAFAAKCAAYLKRGVGLIAVDIVTSRNFNMHNELVRLLDVAAPLMPEEESLIAVAYRPTRRQQENRVEAWPTPLSVGGTLPTLPLAIRGWRAIPVDLEAAYTDARQRSRL